MIFLPSFPLFRDSIIEITNEWIQNANKPEGFNISAVREQWYTMGELVEAYHENRVRKMMNKFLIVIIIYH